MKKISTVDVAIFGGGIAGLWLLNRLRNAGFSALLFESGALGGGQTNKSQGIIHGGMKYNLQGTLTGEAAALADMPEKWQACLEGRGEIDLSAVPILSRQQYLWAPNKITSKLTGFLASASLQGKVNPLLNEEFPTVFKHPSFKGEVFSLNEIVIDVPSLVRELVKATQELVFKIEPLCVNELKFNEDKKLTSATIYLSGKSVEIHAQQFIFTAGSGNEALIQKLNQPDLAMQRRPLHMVLMKAPFKHALYAHCLGFSKRPRLTITTHFSHDGHTIWYLGGELAEEGVKRDSHAQIQATKSELQQLFPWLDFSGAEFASFMIDRAEAKQKKNLKPESVFVKHIENLTVAWPTKLALAPKLADNILNHFQTTNITHQLLDTRELRSWPLPPLAQPIWEEVFCKHVA